MPKYCQQIKFQGSLKYNISMKKLMMNLIFGMQINIEVFYKLILSFWLCLTRHVPSSQNKFSYLCSITRKSDCICVTLSRTQWFKVFQGLNVWQHKHLIFASTTPHLWHPCHSCFSMRIKDIQLLSKIDFADIWTLWFMLKPYYSVFVSVVFFKSFYWNRTYLL